MQQLKRCQELDPLDTAKDISAAVNSTDESIDWVIPPLRWPCIKYRCRIRNPPLKRVGWQGITGTSSQKLHIYRLPYLSLSISTTHQLRTDTYPLIRIFITPDLRMCRRDVNTTVYTCGHTKVTYTIQSCGKACSSIPDNHMGSTKARRPCDDCLA